MYLEFSRYKGGVTTTPPFLCDEIVIRRRY